MPSETAPPADYAQGHAVDRGEQRRVLLAVEEAARAAGAAGVVAFDLDSTLLDNRPRQAVILREYGVAHGLPALEAATPLHIRSWSLAEAMANAGLPAEQVEAHRRPLRAFWGRRFFSSEYCRFDRPIAGAVAYVAALAGAGVKVAYLTGRDASMGEGTRACLARDGFPVPGGDRVHLLLKPDRDIGDDPWKERAHATLATLGRVVAAFDNEPAHINGYARRFPEALCVRLATDDSGRPVPLAAGIALVADFTR